ncbi:MAG: hypothetical protein M3X11_13485 [Acidobacteriota bacterium]|nr:hypothetical protein [Acidobacteriota bacterium]
MKTIVCLFGILSLTLLTVSAANSKADCYIYGRVTYKDGSTCRNCCSVQAELSGGGGLGTMSKSVCTDDSGDYRIDVAYCEVKRVFFKGNTVWEGNQSAKGGVKIDIQTK